MICSANQLTGFYMMGTLVVKGLSKLLSKHVDPSNNCCKTISNQSANYTQKGIGRHFFSEKSVSLEMKPLVKLLQTENHKGFILDSLQVRWSKKGFLEYKSTKDFSKSDF